MEKYSVIIDSLQKHKITAQIIHHNNDLIENVDYLITNQNYFEKDVLYLGKVSDYLEISKLEYPINILLVCDSQYNPEYYDSEKVNCVVLAESPPLDRLREEIQRFLQSRKELQWQSMQLYDCLSNGKGVQALVNLASELLNNPLIIFDQNQRVIAYSQNKRTPKPFLEDKSSLTEIPDRNLSRPININGDSVGWVVMTESNKLSNENTLQLLSVLSNVISVELQKGKYFWQTKEVAVENLFRDLLNDKLQCDELVKERLKFIDLSLENHIFVMVAKYIIDNPDNTPLPYIRELLNSKINRAKCAIYDNKIVMILTRANKSLFADDELQKLNTLFEENHMLAGVSRDFTDIMQIKNYYSQSCKAIELGQRLDIIHKVYFYNDYAEFHLIEMAAKHENILEICNPLLLKLMEEDRRNQGEMLKTLYVYLQTGNNLTESSIILHIHRNTMIYRLKKIEEFLDETIDDPKVAFIINLSMKILHLHEGAEFLKSP
ncbi:helix-turn-helix domain-containing protein [Dehalobacter sp. DCM]|uniref:PucR family transcriptional regulator n=1 Tax=Dehalobacter sp. DCM TaxID=2907827 RepID=UPI003081CCFD|nr:helix-turn-helix domain-containing protein [Dehalobacter sp. DCM]